MHMQDSYTDFIEDGGIRSMYSSPKKTNSPRLPVSYICPITFFNSTVLLTFPTGFRSHHMPVRTFVMKEQLDALKNNFLEDSNFAEYVTSKMLVLKEEEKEQLKMLERDFFVIALNALEKHFTQWRTIKKLPLALAGEARTATIIARWMVDPAYAPGEDEYFHSEIHEYKVYPSRLLNFLTSELRREDFLQYLQVHGDAVRELAEGKKLWTDEGQSIAMKKFRYFVQHTYLPLPSHTQFVEAGVKEAKLVSATGREERQRSQLAIIRNHTVGTFLENAVETIGGTKKHMPKVSIFRVY